MSDPPSLSAQDTTDATSPAAERVAAAASSGPAYHAPALVPDYELLRQIGRGAYGEVWLARSKATGTLRAAKIVWRHRFQDERPYQREFEGIQRFERISREHPSQLALFHIGRNEAEGYFYYVMELADDASVECGMRNAECGDSRASTPQGATAGPDPKAHNAQRAAPSPHSAIRTPHSYVPHTLRADLAQGRLPAVRVLEVGLALTEALGHLHKHGLVHRDVKPSNVVFVNGRPKLADIGLVTDASDKCSIVGTEGYLPPEGPGTAQADIFALGKLLYEAATGLDRRRFPQLPADLREWSNARLVFELNEILLKACAEASRERYHSAEEMRADLALLETGQSVKRLRVLERRWAAAIRAAAAFALLGVVVLGVLYESNRRRQAVTHSLARLHVANGTHLMEQGDLFGSLLSFSEALRLDAGDTKREGNHRARMASVLRECPKLVGLFAHNGANINQAEFSPDSRFLVTASMDDRTARLWVLSTGEERFRLQHPGPVYSAAFSPDGRCLATTSSDNLVHLWNTQSGEALHGSPIRHLAKYPGPHPRFSPEGKRLLTLVDGHTLCLWDAVTGEPLGQPVRHNQAIHLFAFSHDGARIVTLSGENRARLWDGFTLRALGAFESDGQVRSIAFSPDGHTLATAGEDQCVRFWDLETQQPTMPPLKQRAAVDFVAFSPEGDRLAAVCRDRTVQLWDVAARGELVRPLEHELDVIRARFSPDGRYVVTEGLGNYVRMWNADTGEVQPPLLIHTTHFGGAAFSLDGQLVLTLRGDLTLGRQAVALVWSLAGSQPAHLRLRPTASYSRIASSSDGRNASPSGQTVRIIRASSGEPTAQITQTVPIRQVAFSRDNARIVTDDVDGHGQIWDSTTGEPLTPRLPIDYALNTPKEPGTDLPRDPRDNWPAKDLVLLARLLSGKRVAETGGFMPLDLDEPTQAWDVLRRRHPESFSDSREEVLAWREREARACEQALDWWSAHFHLEALLEAKPGDPALQARRIYAEQALANANLCTAGYGARRRVIPPRNSQASDRTIDLSPYYNSSGRNGAKVLAALPSGLQDFAGTVFDVRGLVQLAGQQGGVGPVQPLDAVRDIKVGQKCRRLLFLQGTAAYARDSTEVGSYVVHYANGRAQTFTIQYGRDVRCWWTTQNEPLEVDRSVLAWIGGNPQAPLNEQLVRVFKSAWENPWPNDEITSVDFIAVARGVRPFLVAVTAE